MSGGTGSSRWTAERWTRWLRHGRAEQAAGGAEAWAAARHELLVAVAAAGLPLAPAAHPLGHRCSCDRIGCPAPAAHPVSFAWQTQATAEVAQVERWATADPAANFVTATGRVHDVLDVPAEAGRRALERLLAQGAEVGPVAESGEERMLFFTQTRGTPEDEDEWWPCALDCHPETMAEHPGLRWHCRGSYVLVPPSLLPGERRVGWVRGPEQPRPDPLTLLGALTDACAWYAAREAARQREAEAAEEVAAGARTVVRP
jgi:hypothetical protein